MGPLLYRGDFGPMSLNDVCLGSSVPVYSYLQRTSKSVCVGYNAITKVYMQCIQNSCLQYASSRLYEDMLFFFKTVWF